MRREHQAEFEVNAICMLPTRNLLRKDDAFRVPERAATSERLVNSCRCCDTVNACLLLRDVERLCGGTKRAVRAHLLKISKVSHTALPPFLIYLLPSVHPNTIRHHRALRTTTLRQRWLVALKSGCGTADPSRAFGCRWIQRKAYESRRSALAACRNLPDCSTSWASSVSEHSRRLRS